MSLDLLKKRFSGKPITSQYEEQIENKEQIIEKLEVETHNLSNQVFNLESEKNVLLQELNKARHFEDGAFSIKEKDYINEIQSKENIIKEIKSEFNPLYEKINKQKERLSHKDNLLHKKLKIIKESKEKINKLNHRLNYEKKNSKKVISEIKSERQKTYQEYINNLDIYENTITSKNDMINNYKTKLQESLDKLKEASDLIINLKKDIKINENVRQELREKKEEITNLNGQVYSLSKEVKHLLSLSEENSILEAKLQKAQSFENSILRVDEYKDEIKVKDDIIDEKRQDLLESIKQINNLSTKIDNLQSKNKQDEETIENLKSTVKENKDSFLSQNDDFEDIMKKKDNYIMELKKESETLSEKVVVLSDLARENYVLQNKLQEAENFQNIINDKKDKFIQETGNVNTSNLVSLLTTVSRKKQGNQKLTWEKWLDISENNYLLNLDEVVAKKVFNESNRLIQEAINNSNSSNSVNSQGLKGQAITPVYGLAFDGLRQSLNTTFPGNHAADPTPIDRTYSWWMKSDVTGANRSVFGYGDKTRESFHLNYNTSGTHKNKPNLWLGNGAGEDFYRYWDDTSAQDDGQWHHWMLTVDVSDIEGCKLYVDGTEIGGGTTNHNDASDLNDHADELTIGASDVSNTAGEHFEGSITNFAVFTGLLSDGDAVSHYNNGIPNKDLSGETNLEAYWKMNENSGTTVIDYVGGRNGEFDGDEPTWIKAMDVTNTYHKGKQVIANMSKNERG